MLAVEAPRPGQAEQVVVDPGADGQRIDNFLIGRLKGLPRSRVYRMLRTGQVRVNRGRIRQDYRLRQGDVVRIPPVRLGEPRPAPSPGDRDLGRVRQAILYEDRTLMVLAKPAGLAVHGGSGVSYGVIEALRVLRPEVTDLELAHRLDRETSGCLLVAKRRPTLRRLHALLREGGVEKTYLALVRGDWREPRTVRVPLQKNVLRSGERFVHADAEGKAAETRFEPLARSVTATLVRATPRTGRTHQIRVHAAAAGHPIAGDPKYGDSELNRVLRGLGLRRLFLHAHRLRFPHPDEPGTVEVTAALPPELAAVLAALGLEVP
jgi:23S rRNA pseudouridine955/2504/2580 synthase